MFDSFPQSVEETGAIVGGNGALGMLRALAGGKMRFKDYSHLKPKCDIVDYIDKVNYDGHAVRNYMNREIEKRMFQADLTLAGKDMLILVLHSFITDIKCYFPAPNAIPLKPKYFSKRDQRLRKNKNRASQSIFYVLSYLAY